MRHARRGSFAWCPRGRGRRRAGRPPRWRAPTPRPHRGRRDAGGTVRARASHGTRPGHRCRRRYRSSMREDEAEKTPRRRGEDVVSSSSSSRVAGRIRETPSSPSSARASARERRGASRVPPSIACLSSRVGVSRQCGPLRATTPRSSVPRNGRRRRVVQHLWSTTRARGSNSTGTGTRQPIKTYRARTDSPSSWRPRARVP